MKKTYKHIFFDLDDTLWDNNKKRTALIELYIMFNMKSGHAN